MQLGSFQKDPKTQGYIGSIRTLVSAVDPVRIIPRPKSPDAAKGAPDFDVLGPTGSDFGAGWLQKRQTDGIEYVSVRLYDPAFNNGQTLRPALWPRKDGTFVLIHEPLEPTVAADAQPEPVRPSPANGSTRAKPSSPAPAAGAKG